MGNSMAILETENRTLRLGSDNCAIAEPRTLQHQARSNLPGSFSRNRGPSLRYQERVSAHVVADHQSSNIHAVVRALICSLVVIFTTAGAFDPNRYTGNERTIKPGFTPPGKLLYTVGQDMVGVNLNVLSFSTFKIVVSLFPFVLVGRMVDGRLQSCFYDRVHHKNICQLDDACRMFAKHSLVFPCCLAGALSFSARDEDVKATSRMFIKGLPFVLLMSNLIKRFDVHIVGDGCLRPWNEHFSREKRARGGWPSGHLASVSYAAALYGHRFGAKWAVPLGALTVAVGVSFLNCNRHYISQILAGVGLGTIYGVAASKQVDFRLAQNRKEYCFTAELDADHKGFPAMKFGVSF